MIVEKATLRLTGWALAGGRHRWRVDGTVVKRGIVVGLIDWGDEKRAGPVESVGRLRSRLEPAGDVANRVHDRGVVAVELAGDLGEGERGELAREVDRELARVRDACCSLR